MGEIKYKRLIFSGFAKIFLIFFLVNIFYILSEEGIKGLISESTLAYSLLINILLFSTQYTITTEGIISTYANQRAVFYKWEDIIEFNFVGNRKGKYTVLDEKGNKRDYIAIFSKKDYDDIKEFINQNI